MINKKNLVIEFMKLKNFLSFNQLVQANAIAQKLESILENIIKDECSDPKEVEKHPLWKNFRNVHCIKSFILSGRAQDALILAEKLIDFEPRKPSDF